MDLQCKKCLIYFSTIPLLENHWKEVCGFECSACKKGFESAKSFTSHISYQITKKKCEKHEDEYGEEYGKTKIRCKKDECSAKTLIFSCWRTYRQHLAKAHGIKDTATEEEFSSNDDGNTGLMTDSSCSLGTDISNSSSTMTKDPVQYSLSFKIQVAKYKKTYGYAKTALKFGINESDISSWRIDDLLHQEAVIQQTGNESVQPVREMDTDNTTSENTGHIVKICIDTQGRLCTRNESVQPVREMDTDNTTSENTGNIVKKKPFSCRYCISKFARVGTLKSHMRTFHQGDITKEVLSKKSLSLGISSSRGRKIQPKKRFQDDEYDIPKKKKKCIKGNQIQVYKRTSNIKSDEKILKNNTTVIPPVNYIKEETSDVKIDETVEKISNTMIQETSDRTSDKIVEKINTAVMPSPSSTQIPIIVNTPNGQIIFKGNDTIFINNTTTGKTITTATAGSTDKSSSIKLTPRGSISKSDKIGPSHFQGAGFILPKVPPGSNVYFLPKVPEINVGSKQELTTDSKVKTSSYLLKGLEAHQAAQGDLVCNYCKARFTHARSLKLHIRTYHREKSIKSTSDDNQGTSSETTYDIKIDLQHVQEFYGCKYCNKNYLTEANLQQHIKKIHPEKYECEYCKKRFVNDANLQNHIKRIHPENFEVTKEDEPKYEKRLIGGENDIESYEYSCNACGKLYLKRSSINKHIRASHNDIISKCSICNREFSGKFSLTRHKKSQICTRDIIEPKELIECQICNKKFREKGSLRHHMVKIHGAPKKYATKPLYCCMSACEESFRNLDKLRMHLMEQEEAGGHNINLEKEEFVFDNMEEFKKWKEDIEENDCIRYCLRNMQNLRKDGSFSNVFFCNRSGANRCRENKGNGKRAAKKKGSYKTGLSCPSSIKIHCRRDGIVECKYYKTHIGHGTCLKDSTNILMHQRDRLFIAEKLLEGVEVKRILEELHMKGGRSTYISNQDVSNILNSNLFKRVQRCKSSRNLNVLKKDIDKYEVSSKHGLIQSCTVTLLQVHLQGLLCYKVCALCEVCEHSYSCDCGGNNDKNVLCEHIHAVGAAVNIKNTPQRLNNDNSLEGNNAAKYIEMQNRNEQDCKEVQTQNENFIPERKTKIKEANTILNQMKSSLEKYSIEDITEMIDHIKKFKS